MTDETLGSAAHLEEIMDDIEHSVTHLEAITDPWRLKQSEVVSLHKRACAIARRLENVIR